MFTIISALDKNFLIGNNNNIPWHLPRDLAFFKKTTTNNTIIMGRKTYQSIGKALPNRRNIILSRGNFHAENVEVFTDIQKLIENVKTPAFVIGGAEIYQQFLPYTKRLLLTHIHEEFSGDTYFPKIDFDDWTKVSAEFFPRDDKNPHDLTFSEYIRK